MFKNEKKLFSVKWNGNEREMRENNQPNRYKVSGIHEKKDWSCGLRKLIN